MIKPFLSFDDVLLIPQFSGVKSRKDVDLSQKIMGTKLSIPIISSNMDTITGSHMASAMYTYGGIGALHRFMSIEDNVKEYISGPSRTIVSIGLGKSELERAEALFKVGAVNFLIDVAHGASMEVVKQTLALRDIIGYINNITVGNFATSRSIKDFVYHLGSNAVDNWKVGIGGGSACLTRVVTGCGLPTFASVVDCASTGLPIIADGGCKNSGDIAKALAAGASAVMLGGMLAGTDETPGDMIYDNTVPQGKKYRGSASTESYESQGKIASHRSYEGDSFIVPYKGPVKNVIEQISGGLRSALSYVGASNLTEFRERAEFAEITGAGISENGAHGKK